MLKLKNWRKITEDKKDIVWANKNVISVVFVRTSNNKYVVSIPKNRGKHFHYTHKWFKTKAQALKFAINWMKKHPNG